MQNGRAHKPIFTHTKQNFIFIKKMRNVLEAWTGSTELTYCHLSDASYFFVTPLCPIAWYQPVISIHLVYFSMLRLLLQILPPTQYMIHVVIHHITFSVCRQIVRERGQMALPPISCTCHRSVKYISSASVHKAKDLDNKPDGIFLYIRNISNYTKFIRYYFLYNLWLLLLK